MSSAPKCELMLGQPERMNPKAAAPWILSDWERAFAAEPETLVGLSRHLDALLAGGRAFESLLHGGGAHTAGRMYSEQLLEPLQIPLCRNWHDVEQAINTQRLAFIPLGDWMPELQRMIDLRNILGLRSPIHSLARILNPLGARCGLQSIFHPGYQAVHREASQLLGDSAVVIKGEGGEIEINPDATSHLYGTANSTNWDEEWPALSPQRHVKPESLQPAHLAAFWRGEVADDYGQLAVISTMALALRALGEPREQALERAAQMWAARNQTLA